MTEAIRRIPASISQNVPKIILLVVLLWRLTGGHNVHHLIPLSPFTSYLKLTVNYLTLGLGSLMLAIFCCTAARNSFTLPETCTVHYFSGQWLHPVRNFQFWPLLTSSNLLWPLRWHSVTSIDLWGQNNIVYAIWGYHMRMSTKNCIPASNIQISPLLTSFDL